MRSGSALVIGSFLWQIVLHLSLAFGQPSGFISIDCGSSIESYVDPDTNLSYFSDTKLMEFGERKSLNARYTDGRPKSLWNLRTFPQGNRTCYKLQPVTAGSKYLIRTLFLYGNFDGLNSFPQFDLYLENTFVQTVNALVRDWWEYELIVKATRSYLTLCLCKTNERDPFISAIELRPIPGDAIYPVVNATLALKKMSRNNVGSPNDPWYRYPYDAFDRFWLPPTTSSGVLVSINTSLDISLETDPYRPPLKVMQTACINPSSTEAIQWGPYGPLDSYLFTCIYFAELKKLEANETREFDITFDNEHFYGPMTPSYLKATTVCSPNIYRTNGNSRVELKPTNKSTLSPIVNAIEFYSVVQLSTSITDDGDSKYSFLSYEYCEFMPHFHVSQNGGNSFKFYTCQTCIRCSAVNSLLDIRRKYQITKPWTGDPCLPLNYTWEGVVCSNDTSSPRVVSLDLSNSGLSGEIPASLANLTAIVSINLAGNNLTGSIPNFLANLTQLRDLDLAGNRLTGSIPDFFVNLMQLRVLDLSDNHLSGSVPDELLHKKEIGSLTLRYSGNEQLCSSGACNVHQRKSSQGIIIGTSVSAAVLLLLVVVSSIILVKKKRQPAQTVEKYAGPKVFTFTEVVQMTDKFKQKIGEGGYGPVFYGHLCGQDVAVKILSDNSRQGSNEFYTEIALLSRVHHRNLVSFLGYCDEAENMILIYEYLSKGNLQEILSGKTQITLEWNQRLQIALNAAQGLEYLHSGCKPAIIHRDVKSANILLNDSLEAKLADFGVSKSGMPDGVSHVSTAVVGTPGYLDPEYFSTNWLNEKSDVYSFGVVLLEIISGQQPVMVEASETRIHIAEWVRRHLQKGNHEKVADPNLDARYNVPSFWRVADTALECTADKGIKRPNMNNVVNELKEAIALCSTKFHSETSGSVVNRNQKHSSRRSMTT